MNSRIPLEHVGLFSMKERAEMLGGYLSIISEPKKGTTIGFTFATSRQLNMKAEVHR